MNGNRISVVIRFHSLAALEQLEQCLFSVCLQNTEDIEIIVVVKNFDQAQKSIVEEVCLGQPWLFAPIVKIVDCNATDDHDTRAEALNVGITSASGRYIAFLDYDDVLYHQCYETLKKLLQESKAILSFGRTRLAVMETIGDKPYVISKKKWFFWGDSRRDLWKGNFIVIHSYMIDKERLPIPLLVDTTFTRLEDYALLLRLSVEGDFAKTEDAVCEYRIPLGHELAEEAFGFDRSSDYEQSHESVIWNMNTDKLATLRESLRVNMSLEQFSELMDELADLKKERKWLKEQLEHSEQVWSKHLEEAELLSFRLLRSGHAAVSKPGLLKETVKTVRTFRKLFKPRNK